MKNIFALAIILISCTSYLAQSAFNSKGVTLKVTDIKTVEQNGNVSWNAKTILTNKSHDTLFYFIVSKCEQSNYSLNTDKLALNYEKCGDLTEILALPPSKQREVVLNIISTESKSVDESKSPIKFEVLLFLFKAKSLNEPSNRENGVRALVVSNQVKIAR